MFSRDVKEFGAWWPRVVPRYLQILMFVAIARDFVGKFAAMQNNLLRKSDKTDFICKVFARLTRKASAVTFKM